MGRLSGHQAQVMVLAVERDGGASGNDLVISGSKDHYIKVLCFLNLKTFLVLSYL